MIVLALDSGETQLFEWSATILCCHKGELMQFISNPIHFVYAAHFENN